VSSVGQLRPNQQTIDLANQLDSTQQLLVDAIVCLATATSKCEPERVEYTRARLRISQTSLLRSTLVNSACEYLRPRLSGDQWRTIAALRAADISLRIYSAAHVAEWPSQRIEADWRGFTLESKQISNAHGGPDPARAGSPVSAPRGLRSPPVQCGRVGGSPWRHHRRRSLKAALLILAGGALAGPSAAAATSCSATASGRVYTSVRLNQASDLSQSNGQVRFVDVLQNGKIERLRIVEFQ
jgi:hypothetical protein